MDTCFEWIFWDFDGVLAPDGRYETWDPKDMDELCRLEEGPVRAMERALSLFPDLKIAVSSSWKEHYPFDLVLPLFPESLRHRVYGYTPFLDDAEPEWIRRREILAFLESRGEAGSRWIAVDDLSGHFSFGLFGDQALIMNSAWDGFTEAEADRLIEALSHGYVKQPLDESLLDLKREFVESLPARMETLTDRKARSHAAHKLAGSASIFGFDEISTSARKVEASLDDPLAMERLNRAVEVVLRCFN